MRISIIGEIYDRNLVTIYAKDSGDLQNAKECVICALIEPTNQSRHLEDFDAMVLHNTNSHN